MKELINDKEFLKALILELHELNTHICEQRYFHGGVCLGSMISCLAIRLDDLKSNDEDLGKK